MLVGESVLQDGYRSRVGFYFQMYLYKKIVFFFFNFKNFQKLFLSNSTILKKNVFISGVRVHFVHLIFLAWCLRECYGSVAVYSPTWGSFQEPCWCMLSASRPWCWSNATQLSLQECFGCCTDSWAVWKNTKWVLWNIVYSSSNLKFSHFGIIIWFMCLMLLSIMQSSNIVETRNHSKTTSSRCLFFSSVPIKSLGHFVS